MFGKRRTYFLLLVGAICIGIGSYFNASSTEETPWAPILCAIFLAVGFLIDFFVNRSDYYFQMKKKERLLKKILDSFLEQRIERIRKFDPTVRINVMLICRDRFIKKRFNFIYQYNFFEHHPDFNLKLLSSQGIAGLAVKKRKWILGDRESNNIFYLKGTNIISEDADIDCDLDSKQRRNVEHLKMIISFPIRKLKNHPNGEFPLGDVIGVLNMDSSQKTWMDYSEGNFSGAIVGHRDLEDANQNQIGFLEELSKLISNILE